MVTLSAIPYSSPFCKGGLEGIRMMRLSENSFGKRYKKSGVGKTGSKVNRSDPPRIKNLINPADNGGEGLSLP
jgi:hypothetical protein